MIKIWETWRFKNITLLILSIIIALALSRFEAFHKVLIRLGDFGYIGAFFAGILFVSTFTVATGAVILLVLTESLSAVEIGIIAGIGAVVGDYFIFRFVRNHLVKEIETIYEIVDSKHYLLRLVQTKYFSWSIPVFGAIIIASPLPDEAGITLLGLSKLRVYQFLIVSFILNAIGIFLVVTASTFINP